MNLITVQDATGVSKKMKNNEFTPNELSQATKASMKVRIISAIVGIIIAVPLILLGDFFLFGAVAFILLISTYEIIHCAKRKYCIALYIVAFILAVLMTYWPLLVSLPDFISGARSFDVWHVYTAFDRIYVSVSVLALGAFSVFFMVIIDKGFSVRDACFIFTMMIIITLGYQSALFIRYLPSQAYHAQPGASESYFNLYDNLESSLLLIYVLVATFMTDAGAYFVGVFFGKHKMNPRISPKKTWEGFFGGILISSVVSFGLAMLTCGLGHPLVIGLLDLEHWYLILALSISLPAVSVLGDFVFSSAKRHFDIKDFGNIIPGHGGMLDRLDSVIFSSIFTAVFLSMIQYWGQFIVK